VVEDDESGIPPTATVDFSIEAILLVAGLSMVVTFAAVCWVTVTMTASSGVSETNGAELAFVLTYSMKSL
jgi:hypothetical protein